MHLIQEWKRFLTEGLQEDEWTLDWTARGSVPDPSRVIEAHLIAKEPGVWAADGLCEAVALLSQEWGGAIQAKSLVKQGESFRAKTVLWKWKGPARLVLAFERPAINLASYVSGIATQTHTLVAVIDAHWKGKPGKPRLTATRKTLPGYRNLVLEAVMAGGGHSHRVNLAGGVLIKENHIAASGGIVQAIRGVRAVAPHGLKIEIEVRSLAELKIACKEGVDVVLLDNFSPDLAKRAIYFVQDEAPLTHVEISGGINAETLPQYLFPGVQYLSSGALTHSVRSLDFSLLVKGLA